MSPKPKAKPLTFQQRLQRAMQDGNLTQSDLARWFDRPIPTMRGWIEKGTEPGLGPVDRTHAIEMLGLLETLIRKRKGFPVPRLTPKGRIEHLKDIRAALLP